MCPFQFGERRSLSRNNPTEELLIRRMVSTNLPLCDDVIPIILMLLDGKDVRFFGNTCRRFRYRSSKSNATDHEKVMNLVIQTKSVPEPRRILT
ncbi:hypothetical protein KIN20_021942 [Parelaphostrongylus tenuis]|uniref:Uncharacterized protein n=1 Tax=Parelaphostrongylus tenuis TaxID=148309 RepID=A0AAD5MTD3_PARTN|nr:hypothetical protein KIN20_021942 [Parelaphostrongylus tenuis]